ncbi:MAG: alpha/beta fold hydrolase [Acidimicrobiia bacterium]
MTDPSVRYARSGDVEIAYAVLGDGPIDLVYVPGFISHLDLFREIPPFATIVRELSRFARLIVFDKRGTGLSTRDAGFGSLAERMDDIRAVMDDAGWEHANVFAVSEGGPLALLFAATYPDRVQRLVISGSFACLLPREDPRVAEFDVERFAGWVERNWGSGAILQRFIATPDDATAQALAARYERSATTPRLAGDIMRGNLEIDVRPILDAISVATLVVHHRGDPIVPMERGRELADSLPHPTFVELPGDFHLAWQPDLNTPLIDRVQTFLTGEMDRVATERVLATVMFTDIVDSTKRAADLGDRRWRAMLDHHDTSSNRVVARFGGRIVKQTGDGLLVTFDGPARAVECARVLRDTLGREVPIRAGLHTGEVERRGDDVGGIGVHIAARVAALAGPSEVLVSRTVRDLVVGSDLAFEDRGTHELKGMPEAWQLYAAIE